MNLTDKETAMLISFINEGRDCNGSETADQLIDDNMTWMNAQELAADLGWGLQAVGGVMASLHSKGLISDSGESSRGLPINDFTATEQAIKECFHLTN